jgi:hypothetical protein
MEQFLYIFVQFRMNKLGSDLGQRDKDKFPEMQPGMRQREESRVHYFIAEKEQIHIDRARLLFGFFATAKDVFDPQKPGHHLSRPYLAHLDLYNHIQKVHLALDPDGLRLVDRREAIYLKIGRNQPSHRHQKISRTVAEI